MERNSRTITQIVCTFKLAWIELETQREGRNALDNIVLVLEWERGQVDASKCDLLSWDGLRFIQFDIERIWYGETKMKIIRIN